MNTHSAKIRASRYSPYAAVWFQIDAVTVIEQTYLKFIGHIIHKYAFQ